MSSRLAIDVKGTDKVAVIKLSGHIDEDNNLAELTRQISQRVLLLNLGDVERINSCGVRDWVSWLNELDRAGIALYLIECSPAIMTQVNLVNNFVGKATILSFYAPYFCSSCDAEKMLLIETGEALENLPFRAPSCRCDQCDHTMDFDDIESSYFAFLPTVKSEALDPDVADAVAKFAGETDRKLRSRSVTGPIVSGSTPSGDSSLPTTPNSRELKSLISDSISFSQPEFTRARPTQRTNTILYLVIGLLAVAILLLGYVVLRIT